MSTAPSIYPDTIEIVEVGPRDGLQNETRSITTADKLALIDRAIVGGARRIEVTSFVNPRRVPQMADADAIAAQLTPRHDVTYIGLALNLRGAERALGFSSINQIGAVCVTTDRFATANQGQASDESVVIAGRIIAMAHSAGRRAQATIAAAFGCPYDGAVSEDRVVAIAVQLADAGAIEVALADTIGVADPAQVARLVTRVVAAIAPVPVRIHCHDTRGTGLANVWAAMCAGARTIDASIGGMGGCPFAPGAAGNVATEEVVYMFERAGIATGCVLDTVTDTSRWLAGLMGKPMPSRFALTSLYPPRQARGVSIETRG